MKQKGFYQRRPGRGQRSILYPLTTGETKGSCSSLWQKPHGFQKEQEQAGGAQWSSFYCTLKKEWGSAAGKRKSKCLGKRGFWASSILGTRLSGSISSGCNALRLVHSGACRPVPTARAWIYVIFFLGKICGLPFERIGHKRIQWLGLGMEGMSHVTWMLF